MTTWKPPRGWTVLERLKKAQTCSLCQRQLRRGDTVLWKKHRKNRKARRKRHEFRCVDLYDCNATKGMGGEPFFRPRHKARAHRRDVLAGRS